MGGPGSGSMPEKGGRKKKSALAVVGSGVPAPVTTLPDDVQTAFDRLASLTAGVSFSQDSIALELAARLMVRLSKLEDATDEPSQRLALAVARQLIALLAKFGLTPRDRQILLVPRDDEPELDEFEQMLRERDGE